MKGFYLINVLPLVELATLYLCTSMAPLIINDSPLLATMIQKHNSLHVVWLHFIKRGSTSCGHNKACGHIEASYSHTMTTYVYTVHVRLLHLHTSALFSVE